MIKKLLVLAFLTLGMAGAAHAGDSIADIHSEMGGCESCHNEGTPSNDLVFENEQCIACHGGPDELEGEHHQIHRDMLMCSDCHQPHNMDYQEKPNCQRCHSG